VWGKTTEYNNVDNVDIPTQVRRSANNWTTEWLVTNDACKTKIAQFHLDTHITELHLARRLQSTMNVDAWLVFASSKCDHITPLLCQLHWLKVPWRIDYRLAVLVYKVFMPWHRHTSLTHFIIQQSQSVEGVYVPLRLMNCPFPIPDSQPTATKLLRSPLYGSGTVFCSISHLLRHFLSSALVWRCTSLNSVIHNYGTAVVPTKWHCHFYGQVNRSIYTGRANKNRTLCFSLFNKNWLMPCVE